MTDLQKDLQSNDMMDEHYKITGNEPAMPFEAATENELLSGHITGLTIRQEFAARAMQGLMTTLMPTSNNQLCPNDENVKYMANLAVSAADELIEALNK